MGKQAIKDLHTRLATEVPVTSTNFLTEFPPGMDYVYAHEKSAIYQQEREGGIIEVDDSDEKTKSPRIKRGSKATDQAEKRQFIVLCIWLSSSLRILL